MRREDKFRPTLKNKEIVEFVNILLQFYLIILSSYILNKV